MLEAPGILGVIRKLCTWAEQLNLKITDDMIVHHVRKLLGDQQFQVNPYM